MLITNFNEEQIKQFIDEINKELPAKTQITEIILHSTEKNTEPTRPSVKERPIEIIFKSFLSLRLLENHTEDIKKQVIKYVEEIVPELQTSKTIRNNLETKRAEENTTKTKQEETTMPERQLKAISMSYDVEVDTGVVILYDKIGRPLKFMELDKLILLGIEKDNESAKTITPTPDKKKNFDPVVFVANNVKEKSKSYVAVLKKKNDTEFEREFISLRTKKGYLLIPANKLHVGDILGIKYHTDKTKEPVKEHYYRVEIVPEQSTDFKSITKPFTINQAKKSLKMQCNAIDKECDF